MKKLISAVLALSLLGTVGASAQPWHGGNNYGGRDRGYHDSYRHDYRGHDNTGAVLGVGLGLFALAAILSSQNQRDSGYYQQQDRYQPAYDNSRYDGYYGR